MGRRCEEISALGRRSASRGRSSPPVGISYLPTAWSYYILRARVSRRPGELARCEIVARPRAPSRAPARRRYVLRARVFSIATREGRTPKADVEASHYILSHNNYRLKLPEGACGTRPHVWRHSPLQYHHPRRSHSRRGTGSYRAARRARVPPLYSLRDHASGRLQNPHGVRRVR